MSKVDRAIHGPSWAEVILGAVLSLLLGVVIGALLLVLKPVATVKEMPKELVPGTVYFVQGTEDASKSGQALAKRKAFGSGQSVKVTEEEVNSLAIAVSAPAAAKAGAKPGAAEAPTGMFSAGTPNVRIRNGTFQVGMPVKVDLWGFSEGVVVQARGGFEKDGGEYVFAPNEIYFGSCPVQRLPLLAGYVRSKLLASRPIPEDVASAWSKLASVSIEGNALNLTMP